jgi:hypothetical protein
MKQSTRLPRLPFEARKIGTALFDQQMWCWGQDIRRPEGNLLVAYGLTRQRPPETIKGSSAYAWSGPETQQLMLWGFGLAYIQVGVGGLFLKRFGFTPRLFTSVDLLNPLWTLDQLPRTRFPRTFAEGQQTQTLFVALLHWISRYEQWIQETCGCAYRQRCLSAWQKTICPAEAIAEEWKRLATLCHCFSDSTA